MSETNEYKCPSCGGALEFDSRTQKMKCPYCDAEYDMDTYKQCTEETDTTTDKFEWDTTSSDNEWDEKEKDNVCVYICQSCGGEIVGDDTTASTKCPYCDNNIVIKGKVSDEARPDYIIPFKFDKKSAKEGMRNYLKKKVLLPKAFKSENHIDEIKGVYVPFWLYNSNVQANVRYNGERIRTWSDSNYNYTETSHFLLIREGNIAFENIPEDGSSKMENDLMESLEPYDINEAVDFNAAYLAGFMADKYDESAKDNEERANNRIKYSTEQEFMHTTAEYVAVRPTSSNICLTDGNVKYALYPVWLLNTTWKGEKFVFAMNGQTGKFVGNLPMDKGLFARYFAMLVAILTVIISMILMYFL